MTKSTNIRNRVLLIILLLTYPIICKISMGTLTGFYDDFQLTLAYWGKYISMFVMILYAIAGQYLIKKIIQEKWMVGIILTFVILVVYTFSLVLWLLPIPGISQFVALMSRIEYNFVPALLFVYTIIYLLYGKKSNNIKEN